MIGADRLENSGAIFDFAGGCTSIASQSLSLCARNWTSMLFRDSGLATSYLPTNTLTERSSALSCDDSGGAAAAAAASLLLPCLLSLVSPTLDDDWILDSLCGITGDEGRLLILTSLLGRAGSDDALSPSHVFSGLFSSLVDFASNSFFRFLTMPDVLRGHSASGESSTERQRLLKTDLLQRFSRTIL